MTVVWSNQEYSILTEDEQEGFNIGEPVSNLNKDQNQVIFTEKYGEDTTVQKATTTLEFSDDKETFHNYEWLSVATVRYPGKKRIKI